MIRTCYSDIPDSISYLLLAVLQSQNWFVVDEQAKREKWAFSTLDQIIHFLQCYYTTHVDNAVRPKTRNSGGAKVQHELVGHSTYDFREVVST